MEQWKLLSIESIWRASEFIHNNRIPFCEKERELKKPWKEVLFFLVLESRWWCFEIFGSMPYAIQAAFSFSLVSWESGFTGSYAGNTGKFRVFTGLSLSNFQRKVYHNSLWMIIQICGVFSDRASVQHITIFFPSSLSSGASMGRHMLLSHWPFCSGPSWAIL